MARELPTDYQEFIYQRTYSRWLPKEQRREGRREIWRESVERYRDFLLPRVPASLRPEFEEAIQSFTQLQLVGSMRALWTAGPALEEDNIGGFNCAYLPLESLKDFGEMMYILMHGTGVGVSVERQYVSKMPRIPDNLKTPVEHNLPPIIFEDSKRGWAEGFQEFLEYLFAGYLRQCQYFRIRPEGARLNTFGGRASGPEPLKRLVEFVTELAWANKGRRMTSENCADIACKIADVVVVGGVRRSAILVLTNPSDRRMAKFKTGEFWLTHPHRALANISSCYTEQPDSSTFLEDWLDLVKSGNGERGIVNREALQRTCPDRRDPNHEFGVNPCGEVVLRPRQFCNLVETPYTTDRQQMRRRLRHATLLAVLQSTLLDYNYLDDAWRQNSDEERLIGVSLTGLMDVASMGNRDTYLSYLRDRVNDDAEEFARELDIPEPTATTCVKPSGTVSQLLDTSSGIHPRYAKQYIRRVRVNRTDPIAQLLRDQGIPVEPEVGQSWEDASTLVFSFPIKAPEGAITRHDMSAMDQLDHWLTVKKFWCEHNPSTTIFVPDESWPQVGGWVYENWDQIGGITFLPHDGGSYPKAPYEEITEATYEKLAGQFPEIDWSRLPEYENQDNTIGGHELSCAGGGCEI